MVNAESNPCHPQKLVSEAAHLQPKCAQPWEQHTRRCGGMRAQRDARLGTVQDQEVISMCSSADGKAHGPLKSIPLSQLSHLDMNLR